MKATGIVRRIDDLGRVVIPKEIRRTLREGGFFSPSSISPNAAGGDPWLILLNMKHAFQTRRRAFLLKPYL